MPTRFLRQTQRAATKPQQGADYYDTTHPGGLTQTIVSPKRVGTHDMNLQNLARCDAMPRWHGPITAAADHGRQEDAFYSQPNSHAAWQPLAAAGFDERPALRAAQARLR